MQEVYEFLKECGVYYLATIDNTKPRVRPFGTVDLFDNKLYIQTSKEKNVSKQIALNPNVELCAFNNEKWIRLSGKLIRDDSILAKEHMLDNYPNLKSMYNAHDDKTEVLYFQDAEAVISSFTSEPKIIKF